MSDRIHDPQTASPADRAVSPVIGVILMVAVTVMLAAVTGTFAMDLGSAVGSQTPQASLTIEDHNHDYDPDGSGTQSLVTITHDGGDSISGDEVLILVRNNSDNSLLTSYDQGKITSDASQDNSTYDYGGAGNFSASDDFATGDVIEIIVGTGSSWSADDLGDDEKVSVVVIDTNTDNQIASATVRVS